MSVLIIIPAYNEEETILNAVNKIKKYNEEHDEKYDYVVINDGSTDKTETILRENNLNHVELIHNLGIGGAVQAGYIYAYQNNYDVAVQYDGDGQHDIAYVSKIVEPIINEGYNMVIGSRFVDGHKSKFQTTGARRMGIKLISNVIKFKTKKRIKDTTSGFRAVDKKVIKMFVRDYPVEYPEPISTVNVLLSGLNVTEVPVEMNERQGGSSSIQSLKSAYYMINVILSILSMKGSK
ncbi:glycosyltransferase family 2 protein [Kandleria vitulina]|uniref:glycosyltransferase family 2 protein n=1 Tax=Kandleria vitulina TaxID=1630 RepID=UPI00048CEA2A|nr:glycosyltransferase family 2 protein [Kandleria vitulina]